MFALLLEALFSDGIYGFNLTPNMARDEAHHHYHGQTDQIYRINIRVDVNGRCLSFLYKKAACGGEWKYIRVQLRHPVRDHIGLSTVAARKGGKCLFAPVYTETEIIVQTN